MRLTPITTLFGLSAALLCGGCGSSLAEQTAQKLCDCPASKEMIALRKQASDKNNPNAAEAVADMRLLAGELQQCTGDLPDKVKELSEQEMNQFDSLLSAALNKKCPDLAPALLGK